MIGAFRDIVEAVDEETLDKITHLFNLPRGWGTVFQDGPGKGRWYRRKRDGYHDLIRPDAFKKLIKVWPIILSVSNHDGSDFNNFQSFGIYDFDNSKNPEKTKEPLEIIAKKHDEANVNYLAAESGGKGYHIEFFMTAPVHSKEVEQFQDVILELCAKDVNEEVDGKTVGFIKITDGEWAYFDNDHPYDPDLPIINTQDPSLNQPCTIIEFLTAIGDGKMIKAPFSQHPKYKDRLELPMTIAHIMKHDRNVDPTEEDVIRGCNLIKRLKRTPYEPFARSSAAPGRAAA